MRSSISAALLIEAAAALSEGVTARLLKNEVVFANPPLRSRGVQITALKVVRAPVADVWPILRDCSNYKDWYPNALTSNRTDCSGPTGPDDMSAALDSTCVCSRTFAATSLSTSTWITSTDHLSRDDDGRRAYRRAWSQLAGSNVRNSGSWRVEEFEANPEWSLVNYSLDVESTSTMPTSLQRSMSQSRLPEVFDRIEGLLAARPRDGGHGTSTSATSVALDANSPPSQRHQHVMYGSALQLWAGGGLIVLGGLAAAALSTQACGPQQRRLSFNKRAAYPDVFVEPDPGPRLLPRFAEGV